MFVDHFAGLVDKRLEFLAELKRISRPIVMYGSGEYSQVVERFLYSNGLEVAARFVDSHHETSAGEWCFEDVASKFDEFCVVLGIANVWRAWTAMSRHTSDQILGVYHFALSPHYLADINHEFINRNTAALDGVYNALFDELSKQTFLNYLKTQVSGDNQFLNKVMCDNQYFQDFISVDQGNEIFVDAGAYVGDTLEVFINKTRGRYKKYYAFEPDVVNFEALKQLIVAKGLQNVQAIGCGLGCREDTLRFTQGSEPSTDSKVSEIGNVSVQIVTIDHSCPDATFIKMDIEGAELEALKGAEGTIRSNLPKIAVCAYHTPSHLWELLNYIKSIGPQYRFYFRHHQLFSTELVLYAVPS